MIRPRRDDHPDLLPWHAAGRLDPEQTRRIQEHLEVCAGCARASESMARMSHDLKAVAGPHATAEDLVELEAGGLHDVARRARLETHLSTCTTCRDDLEALRSASARLAGAPPRAAVRPWALAAAAMVLVLLAAAVVWRWNGSRDPGDVWLPAQRGGVERPLLRPPGPWTVTIQLPASAPAGHYEARVLGESGASVAELPPAEAAQGGGRLHVDLPPLERGGRFHLVLRPAGSTGGAAWSYPFETGR